jgi:hypothetical protein
MNQLRSAVVSTAAIVQAPTPSGPGKTTLGANSAFYGGKIGYGFGLAHRFNVDTPVIVHGSFGTTSDFTEKVGRVGLAVEF